eukprot:SM000223S07309  [mRNA]  locus=s223:33432:34178:- [translate_table: standard]
MPPCTSPSHCVPAADASSGVGGCSAWSRMTRADADIHAITASTSQSWSYGDVPIPAWSRIAGVRKQLCRFVVSSCRSIGDGGVARLAIGCSMLQHFSVGRCKAVLLKECPEIRRLGCQQSWSVHLPQLLYDGSHDLSRFTSWGLWIHMSAEGGPDPNIDRPRPWKVCPLTLALEKLTVSESTISTLSFASFLLKATRPQILSSTACTIWCDAGASSRV